MPGIHPFRLVLFYRFCMLTYFPSLIGTWPDIVREYFNDVGSGALWAAKVPFCDYTTGSSSIAIRQRNVYLILFLIACLVASVVFWMRRKCFSRSGCALYL